MNEYKISLIVPIFNMEKYIENCLKSIINQSIGFENIELILCDDYSTDKTYEIINEYAKKYSNIKIIRLKENSGGAGKPKNEGLKVVSSNYIMFLDPDDELFLDGCEILYNEIINTNADVITGNAIDIKNDKEIIDLIYLEDKYEIEPQNSIKEYKSYRVWGSIFKKELIKNNNINFLTTKSNEDTYFAYKSFLKANKIIYLNDKFIVKYYIRNEASLSKTFTKKHIISTIEAFYKIRELLINENQEKWIKFDPFVLNIYGRFDAKWLMNNNEKREVLNKVYDYVINSPFEFNLSIHFNLFNKLILRKKFNMIILIQKYFAFVMNNNFLKNHVFPKLIRKQYE